MVKALDKRDPPNTQLTYKGVRNSFSRGCMSHPSQWTSESERKVYDVLVLLLRAQLAGHRGSDQI